MWILEIIIISSLFFVVFSFGVFSSLHFAFLFAAIAVSTLVCLRVESLILTKYEELALDKKHIELKRQAWRLRYRSKIFTKLFSLVLYVFFITKEVTLATYQMFRTFCKTKGKLKSGFFDYDYSGSHFLHKQSNLYIFAVSVTLTPSTIVSEINENDKFIRIHYCVEDNDIESLFISTKDFEKKLSKVLRFYKTL